MCDHKKAEPISLSACNEYFLIRCPDCGAVKNMDGTWEELTPGSLYLEKVSKFSPIVESALEAHEKLLTMYMEKREKHGEKSFEVVLLVSTEVRREWLLSEWQQRVKFNGKYFRLGCEDRGGGVWALVLTHSIVHNMGQG